MFNDETIELYSCFPENFFDTHGTKPYEEFSSLVISKATLCKDIRRGSAINGEPDYFLNNFPIELTLASNTKKNNIVHCINKGNYKTDDVKSEVYKSIESSIVKKCNKNYNSENNTLSVFVPIPLICWTENVYYGGFASINIKEMLPYLEYLNKAYIQNTNNIYNNILIIIPSIKHGWFVVDVNNLFLALYDITSEMNDLDKTPFFIENFNDEETERFISRNNCNLAIWSVGVNGNYKVSMQNLLFA